MANDIRDKIRALLAKAQASEHEGEAALFFAKAQELMEDHQVELFELHTEDPMGQTVGGFYQSGPTSYKSKVQVSLAYFYGAEAVLRGTSKRWEVVLVGPESSRMTTEIMTEYVWAQVCKEGGKLAHQGRYNRGEAIRHIVNALLVRIAQEMNRRKVEPAREGTSRSLVVVGALKAYMDKAFGETTEAKWRGPKSLKQSAVDAAKNISLNHQVHTGKGTLRLQ